MRNNIVNTALMLIFSGTVLSAIASDDSPKDYEEAINRTVKAALSKVLNFSNANDNNTSAKTNNSVTNSNLTSNSNQIRFNVQTPQSSYSTCYQMPHQETSNQQHHQSAKNNLTVNINKSPKISYSENVDSNGNRTKSVTIDRSTNDENNKVNQNNSTINITGRRPY